MQRRTITPTRVCSGCLRRFSFHTGNPTMCAVCRGAPRLTKRQLEVLKALVDTARLKRLKAVPPGARAHLVVANTTQAIMGVNRILEALELHSIVAFTGGGESTIVDYQDSFYLTPLGRQVASRYFGHGYVEGEDR